MQTTLALIDDAYAAAVELARQGRARPELVERLRAVREGLCGRPDCARHCRARCSPWH